MIMTLYTIWIKKTRSYVVDWTTRRYSCVSYDVVTSLTELFRCTLQGPDAVVGLFPCADVQEKKRSNGKMVLVDDDAEVVTGLAVQRVTVARHGGVLARACHTARARVDVSEGARPVVHRHAVGPTPRAVHGAERHQAGVLRGKVVVVYIKSNNRRKFKEYTSLLKQRNVYPYLHILVSRGRSSCKTSPDCQWSIPWGEGQCGS